MALELGSAAAKIAVAIFETCRHIVEDRAFDAAADRPAVKTVLVAPGSRSVGEAHRGPDILVAAARVQQGVVAYEIACANAQRSEEHTSELQSLMRISYAVFCLKKKNTTIVTHETR